METAEKFVEAVHDKYSSCLKDKSVHKVFQRLQYAIKLASLKVKELEENIQDGDIEEDDQRRTIGRKSFQESLPYSKEIGTTRAEVKGLKASQPGEKIPIGHPDASNPKLPANNRNNGAKDYSFLFKFSRWGGEGNAYHGNPNRKRDDDPRRPKKSGNLGGPPGGVSDNCGL